MSKSLVAIASIEGERRQIFNRLGYADGKVYHDLANEMNQVVEIDTKGYRVIDDPPVLFHRPETIRPLPRPAVEGDVSLLKELVDLDGDNFKLLVGFVMGCLSPFPPYPLLVLYAPAGAGKSRVFEAVKGIIDPANPSLMFLPDDKGSIVASAKERWLLAYSNVGFLTKEQQNIFCALSTDGGVVDRKLYTNHDVAVYNGKRPVALNGITEVVTQSDLLDRSVIVRKEPIAEGNRLPESQLDKMFEERRPIILTGLYEAVSTALRNLGSVKLDKTPRMADFARWVVAAEPSLHWGAGEFIKAYMGAIDRNAVNLLDENPFGMTFIEFLIHKYPVYPGRSHELSHRVLVVEAPPKTLNHCFDYLVRQAVDRHSVYTSFLSLC